MKIITCIIGIILLFSCLETPDQPELSDETKTTFYKIKNYLKCEKMTQHYSRERSNDYDRLFFQVVLSDIQKEHANYDSINEVILYNYLKNGYQLDKCERISIYYMRSERGAKLRKAYFFDNKFKVIEVAYH